MSETKIKACPFCGGEAKIKKGSQQISVNHSDTCVLRGNVVYDYMLPYWNRRAGDREPDATRPPEPSTLASAPGLDAKVRNAVLAYDLLEKVKQILHATDEVAEDGCRLAATVIVNLERGALKDDARGTLRTLAHHVLRQDPK